MIHSHLITRSEIKETPQNHDTISTNETRLIRNLQRVARRRNERVYCITFEGAIVLYIMAGLIFR